jgi:four helix bundle protein
MMMTEQGTGNKGQGTASVPVGFKQLLAWQKGDDLAAEVFAISEELDSRHRWLGLQLIKAAASVTAKISEGYGRSNLGDYLRFLEFAGGSLNEVENFLHFAERNKIVHANRLTQARELRVATGNLLFGLSRSLRHKQRAAGNWQRGLKETTAEYGATSAENSLVHVPSSMFQSDHSQFDSSIEQELKEEHHHA